MFGAGNVHLTNFRIAFLTAFQFYESGLRCLPCLKNVAKKNNSDPNFVIAIFEWFVSKKFRQILSAVFSKVPTKVWTLIAWIGKSINRNLNKHPFLTLIFTFMEKRLQWPIKTERGLGIMKIRPIYYRWQRLSPLNNFRFSVDLIETFVQSYI